MRCLWPLKEQMTSYHEEKVAVSALFGSGCDTFMRINKWYYTNRAENVLVKNDDITIQYFGVKIIMNKLFDHT